MRISDWSSDVCSSDLPAHPALAAARLNHKKQAVAIAEPPDACCCFHSGRRELSHTTKSPTFFPTFPIGHRRSEEHTSELQSLMRISYAVFCLKKKKIT